MVTTLGYIQADTMLHCVYLPENYDETVYWHEALHVALMTAEYHGVQSAIRRHWTYLQGYIAEEFNRSRLQFMADKKAFWWTACDRGNRDSSCIHYLPWRVLQP
ncbi:hypothetical protein QM058_27985 [Klebsiella pneumoniae]|uniref:hypothetical protein n=1 Tax=Klebsiella pneumoniae TaxID=573 RepID=UPI0029492E75|nr:hypothetical protein [Klebsiella pneumoniae]MDV5570679.1 hypothetical protein [Klebsiella pneumoniae]